MTTTTDIAAGRVRASLERLSPTERDELLPLLAIELAKGLGPENLPAGVVEYLKKPATQRSLEKMSGDAANQAALTALVRDLHEVIGTATFESANALNTLASTKKVAPPKVGQAKGGLLAQMLSMQTSKTRDKP